MDIQLNGELRRVADDLSIAGLLEAIGLAQRKVAVEVNREIVPRGQHAQHRLACGDQVEIVYAVGGG